MEHKISFDKLPSHLQDELRDAPIASIEEGKVIVEAIALYNEKPHHFSLELVPREMTDTAILYVTQDLEGVEVKVSPIYQSLSA